MRVDPASGEVMWRLDEWAREELAGLGVVLRATSHVHHHHRQSMFGGDGDHRGVGESGDIVEQVDAGFGGGTRDDGAPGVHGGRDSLRV